MWRKHRQKPTQDKLVAATPLGQNRVGPNDEKIERDDLTSRGSKQESHWGGFPPGNLKFTKPEQLKRYIIALYLLDRLNSSKGQAMWESYHYHRDSQLPKESYEQHLLGVTMNQGIASILLEATNIPKPDEYPSPDQIHALSYPPPCLKGPALFDPFYRSVWLGIPIHIPSKYLSQSFHNQGGDWDLPNNPRPERGDLNGRVQDIFSNVHSAGNIEPPFLGPPPQSSFDVLRLEAAVTAAKNGNNQLMGILISSSLVDPDPHPIPARDIMFSTPMLAAIGRQNIKVVELLLKQELFNPTRRFWGLAYSEIARDRQGPVWREEVRILKQAHDDYANRHLKILNPKASTDVADVMSDTVIGTIIAELQTYPYGCEFCRCCFADNDELRSHQQRCPTHLLQNGDSVSNERSPHSKLQSSNQNNPLRLPIRPAPVSQSLDNTGLFSDSTVRVLQNKTECHSDKHQGLGDGYLNTNTRHLGRPGTKSFAENPPATSALTASNTTNNPRMVGESMDRDGRERSRLSETEQSGQKSRDNQRSESTRMSSTSNLSAPQASSSSSLSSLLRHNSRIPSSCTTPSLEESEASNTSTSASTSEASESRCDEEDSAPTRRAERKRALLRDLMDIVHKITSSAMVDGESGPSNTARGGSSSAGSSSAQKDKRHGLKGKRRLMKNDENNDQGDDENQQPKRIKSNLENGGSNAARRFACPYYQRSRHQRRSKMNLPGRACYGPGFRSIHRVKEHLSRAHILPLRCHRCDADFSSETSLYKHMKQDTPCEPRTAQPREGINPATERLLRSRKELDGRTEEEKWERIYIILFPADNPMDLPSPYYESYIGADVAEGSPSTESTRRRYDEFFQSEFSQRIYKVLEQKVDEALDSAEKGLGDELKRQLPGICRDIQTELYKEFQASIEAERELDHSGPGENAAEIPNSELEATLPGAWLDSPYAPWSQFLLENQATAPSSLIAPFPGDFGNIPSLDTLPIPSGSDVIDHGLRAVSAVLFKVRAVFDYTSDHVDDLSFRAGQIVTVVDEQDANWYRGEYVDDFGARKEGMFPRNFVEKYVPIVPPRPART